MDEIYIIKIVNYSLKMISCIRSSVKVPVGTQLTFLTDGDDYGLHLSLRRLIVHAPMGQGRGRWTIE